MKFFLSLAFAVSLITFTASAQHANIGIKGGLNVYNIHNDNDLKFDTRLGFHAGLLGHIHLTKELALQPEVMYSAQGAKYNILNDKVKFNLGYINVPVMLQYMFNNGFRLQAGPQAGFLISAKSEINNVKTDVKDNLKTVDFGIGAGLGYVDPKTGLGIDARYNLGLSNINDNSSVKSTNRGAQIGLFYLFNHR